MKYLKELGIDIMKVRGQCYDGASVMSGSKGGYQKKLRDYLKSKGVETPIPLVHCASHNLNLVINDAVGESIDSLNCFGTVEEIYSFFSKSLNRWAELALTEDTVNKLNLKRLCTTRWSSRIDAIRAIKSRYVHILKVLTKIGLSSKDSKERASAVSIKKIMETFEFVLLSVLWEKGLTALQKASKELQSVKTHLSVSKALLEMALSDLVTFRSTWDYIWNRRNLLSEWSIS